MGQAFSRANVVFCRSDVISDVYNNLGGWDYDRICTAWASFFTSSEEENLADGTPSVFVADLTKFQRITGLSKTAAQQLGQIFKLREHGNGFSQQRIARFPATPWKARSGSGREDPRQVRILFPMFEILVVIVVLANLKRVTKLSLLFSLFSLNGVLSEAEFFLICYFVFRGMAMAVKRPVPGYGVLESLVVDTFDELLEKRCTENSGCLRSSSTRSTGSAATSTGTSDSVLPKRNSSIQELLRRSSCYPPGQKKQSSMSEIEIALARLQRMQEEAELPKKPESCCSRREMTFKDFLCLTLGPGSALDLIFKGLHGDCPLTIAAHLDFTRSMQFQTRLFQNAFLVQQWLQNPSSTRTTNKVIRLTALLSVCIDLAEKAAEITREIYSVIAADRRMALQGMACVEMPFSSASDPKVVKQRAKKVHQNDAPAVHTQCDTSPGRRQHQENSLPPDGTPASPAKAGCARSAPTRPRRLSASVLPSLLAEQHMRRQVRHWWPDLRIETTLDSLPERPRLFRKLMDVFSSRLYGNLVSGSSVLRCRITHTHSLRVKSIIHAGGRESWIEAAVTQGLDTGRDPPVRVIAEADTKRVLSEGSTDRHTEEVTMELPDVRDNYYLVFTVKSWASDNEIVTVGRGSVLLSTFAEEKVWTHTFVPIDPAHSPAAAFAYEDPQIGCSLLLETQGTTDAIECNPLRLNSLNYCIRDVMFAEHCALCIHFENGQQTSVGAALGSNPDINTVALSVGIVYRRKPVAGVIFFPFAENESLVGLTDYGCLKLSFWKNINETYVKLPASPRCVARGSRCSFSRVKGLLNKKTCECAQSDVARPAKHPAGAVHNSTTNSSCSPAGPEKVGVDATDSNNPRGHEYKPASPFHTGSGSNERQNGRNQYPADSFRVYSSTISRNSTGSRVRDSTGRARRYSFGSACRSGFPLFASYERTKIYRETQPTQAICTLPTGDVTVPLRLLCPQEFFERSPEIAELTRLAFSTEEEKRKLNMIVKDSRPCSIVNCASGVSAKTACLVKGTAHVSCLEDVTDYRSICGSDAILRAAGGCILNCLGQEMQYDPPPPKDVHDNFLLMTCNRRPLLDTLIAKTSSKESPSGNPVRRDTAE